MGEEMTKGRRKSTRRLRRLGISLVIILLLVVVVWVTPVASQVLCVPAEIVPSWVAGPSLI
jgi:hypothetical protein